MIDHPAQKYRAATPIDLPNRQWPTRTITSAPIWLSTDLRDGNQALFEPMNRERKLRFFHELVALGFKEIEVGFPAASRTDFDIVRHLIDEQLIPADVTPMVMTQLRRDLISETVRATAGAKRVIVHLYNAIAPVWREVVFNKSVDEIDLMVAEHVQWFRDLTEQHPETEWVLQYSPETFCMAELEVSLRVCNTAIRTWDASPTRPIIINLPTTVEVATPNVFADQIEWMDRHLDRRESVILSVHPHNDRGTGVACAEQALLAGAQRVEGCLFGNGERSGNADLVTLALNLYTQGVHPRLDFSNINAIARTVEDCTALPIHPRHPYVGDLVFTAFSGSHQDAIAKGFAAQKADGLWQVPYLPIDPQDLGRTYDGIVRINSQSGKGGIAYLLQQDHGILLPRRMQVEFGALVQKHADAAETELDSAAIWQLFQTAYLTPSHTTVNWRYHSHQLQQNAGRYEVTLYLQQDDGYVWQGHGVGNGTLEAALNALGWPLRIDSYEERSTQTGIQSPALAIIEGAWPDVDGTRFAAAQHQDCPTAALQALLNLGIRMGASLPPSAA